jgi:outer membrane lipopolysaccharide assembly protein LptE/RlpB
LKAFEQSAENSPPVRALRRQLEERDEHIVKLQSRLNVLKLIEEDRQKRKHFRHRRATITQPK